MVNHPIDRNKLAKRLTRGVDSLKSAERRSREMSEAEAREYVQSACHALSTIAEAVAKELDTTLLKVDL